MLHTSTMYRTGGALFLAMAVGGFGLAAHSQAAPSRTAAAATMKKVLIKETNNRYHYTPLKITVAKGTTVTWTNKTDVEHNVSDTQNGMKVNKDIKQGKTVSFTFTKAGTYKYHCEYHPYMKGTVVVK